MGKKISVCRSSSSMSSIMGNVTYVIKNFMIGLFPKEFFKSVYVDTMLSQIELEREDIFKKEKPLLIIRPKITLDENTVFGMLPDWISTNHYIYTDLVGNYKPVFYDDINKIFMYTAPDRIKMNFEIEIHLPTKMQQINTAYYFKGSVLQRSYFYLNDVRLETEIPKYYVSLIADSLQYNLKEPIRRTDFAEYLDKYSKSLITEKIKTSSGNPAYFYIHSCNILSMFESLDIDDGESNNQIVSNFKINMNLGTEFWTPLNYILETEIPLSPEALEEAEELFKTEYFISESEYVNNFTLQFVIPERSGDKILLRKQGYITDDTTRDILDIASLFNKDLGQVIKYNTKYSLDNDEVFHIDLWDNDSKVARENVLIDWSKLHLTNMNCLPNTTYHLALYGKQETINRILYRINQINDDVYTK